MNSSASAALKTLGFNGAFSHRWQAAILFYWNKRTYLGKKRRKLSQDWFWTLTWLPWFHVKTLSSRKKTSWLIVFVSVRFSQVTMIDTLLWGTDSFDHWLVVTLRSILSPGVAGSPWELSFMAVSSVCRLIYHYCLVIYLFFFYFC